MELLLEERMVLEAIGDGGRSLMDIIYSTGLDTIVVSNIMPELLMKNIIKYKDEQYFLDRETSPNWIKETNRPENAKTEIKELLASSVDTMNRGASLKLKKVYLNEFEEKLLKIEMNRIDKFIEDLRNNPKAKAKVKDMKVIFWGHGEYGSIINNS